MKRVKLLEKVPICVGNATLEASYSAFNPDNIYYKLELKTVLDRTVTEARYIPSRDELKADKGALPLLKYTDIIVSNPEISEDLRKGLVRLLNKLEEAKQELLCN